MPVGRAGAACLQPPRPLRAAPRTAGAHILSGNVLQPTALDELLPEWREDGDCPIHRQPATASRFYYLTRRMAVRLPNPPQMKHKGNYVISLRWVWGQGGNGAAPLGECSSTQHAGASTCALPCLACRSDAVRWMGRRAEEAGVEIFPGFAGARVVYGPAGDVHGVQVRLPRGARHGWLAGQAPLAQPCPPLPRPCPLPTCRQTTLEWGATGGARKASS